jgi:hypothetical protein
MIEIKPMDIDPRSRQPRIRSNYELPARNDVVNDFVSIGMFMNFIKLNSPQQ